MAVKPSDYTDDPTIEPLIARLFDAGEHLPQGLHRALIDADASIDAVLQAILEDPRTAYVDAPGRGWAPLHAAAIAAARRAKGTVRMAG